ncbi:MAG: AtpZ/AtpI family protein [Desulfosudaceae bacterium]
MQLVMQIGLTMAGCIVFCFFLGYLLDNLLGTKFIFIIVFTLAGVAGGANVVYRQIMDTLKTNNDDSNR